MGHGLSADFHAWHATFMCVVCALLSIVYVLTFARHVLTAGFNWWKSLDQHNPESTEMKGIMEDEVVNKRVYNFQRASQACNWVAAVVAAGVPFNVVLGSPRYMTPIQDYSLVLFTLCTLLIANKPRLTTSRSFACWYSILMLIACLAGASGGDGKGQAFFVESFLLPTRIMLSVAYGGLWLVFWWNLLYNVAFLIGTGSTWNTGFLMVVQTVWQYRSHCMFGLGVVFATYVTNEVLKMKVRHEFEAKVLNKESSAMTELLELVCDVVVELDGDLCIASASPKFAAFTTLNGKKDMRGLKFQQFMPIIADSERFESLLRSCQGEEGRTQPGAVHVTLCDCLGNNMQMEVFFVHYLEIDRCSHYFVGVREFTDLASPMQMPARPMRTLPAIHADRHKTNRKCGITPSSSSANDELHHVDVEQGSVFGGAPHGSHDEEPGISTLLDSSGSTEGSSQCDFPVASAARMRGKCRMPQAKPTIDPAKDMMLTDLVLHWNYAARTSRCCPWHDAMIEVKSCVRRLEAHACSQHFGENASKEVVFLCEGCGVVALTEQSYLAGRPLCCPVCSGSWVSSVKVVHL